MNILIVDDNNNIRMLLHLMLSEYAENNNLNLLIEEAEDGQAAVARAEKKHFDIIFMDILMPRMDGMDATKIIHSLDKKTMIIAVSSVEDDEQKKIILRNGAEDYLSKPLNGDIFKSRIKNYINIIESRYRRKLVQTNPLNLFTNEIRSYYTHFYADDEDQLSEFWEFYLMDESEYEGLSDIIRFIYTVGMELLRQKKAISIYDEQNDSDLYITLECSTDFDAEWIMDQADKNNFLGDYKVQGSLLSTRLEKKVVPNYVIPAVKTEVSLKQDLSPKKQVETKEIFNILDNEDYNDLEDSIGRLNSVLLILGSSEIESHEVKEIVSSLGQIAKTIASYHDLYKISGAINRLYKEIYEHKENFIKKSSHLGPLAKAFGNDLSRWFDSLFITGAPSINYLDDSIISNAEMILNFLKIDEHGSDDDVDHLFF